MRPSADKSVRGVTQEGIKNKEELTVRWQRAGALVRFFAPLNNRFVHPALARPDVLFACRLDRKLQVCGRSILCSRSPPCCKPNSIVTTMKARKKSL
jgi:hypothetical protein